MGDDFPVFDAQRSARSLIVLGDLRRLFVQLKLCAYSLDLPLQFSDGGCEIPLLLSNRRLQSFYFVVLFEKLVEQHGIHRFVAHGAHFSIVIASHEIRIYLFYLLGYEPGATRLPRWIAA